MAIRTVERGGLLKAMEQFEQRFGKLNAQERLAIKRVQTKLSEFVASKENKTAAIRPQSYLDNLREELREAFPDKREAEAFLQLWIDCWKQELK